MKLAPFFLRNEDIHALSGAGRNGLLIKHGKIAVAVFQKGLDDRFS
jgi:hypothetical protein